MSKLETEELNRFAVKIKVQNYFNRPWSQSPNSFINQSKGRLHLENVWTTIQRIVVTVVVAWQVSVWWVGTVSVWWQVSVWRTRVVSISTVEDAFLGCKILLVLLNWDGSNNGDQGKSNQDCLMLKQRKKSKLFKIKTSTLTCTTDSPSSFWNCFEVVQSASIDCWNSTDTDYRDRTSFYTVCCYHKNLN